MNACTGRWTAVAFNIACLLFSFSTVRAATITVTTDLDDVFPDANGVVGVVIAGKCTLRMAIAAANTGNVVGDCAQGSVGADVIVFSPAFFGTTPRTITLASVLMPVLPFANNTAILVVTGPLTITGPGSGLLTIDGNLAGNDGRRTMVVTEGVDDTLFQFTMTGVRFYRGRTIDLSSGCLFSREHLTLDDVVFENCESVGGANNSGFGGALGVGTPTAGTSRPDVNIANSKFLGNRAVRGVAAFTGVGTETRRADNGAAFFGSGNIKVGAVALNNVLFSGNSAEAHGALLIQNATSVVISHSHFAGNAATGVDPFVSNGALVSNGNGRYGGFLVVGVTGDVTINNQTRVNGNLAHEERGGFGVQTVGGTVNINQVDVTGNYVNRGRIGGFEVLTDTFTGSNCNGAQLRPVNISEVRVQGNSVATNTGGFRVTCSGALTMSDSVVIGNETRGYQLRTTETVGTANSAGQIAQANDATAAQSTATLTRVLFRGNETNSTLPSNMGGGGFNVFTVNGLGAFTADSIRVVDNFANGGNGGLTLTARGAGRNYLVVNSEISGNEAPNISALYMETDGNYTLRNSTISGNRTSGGGGSTVKFNANSNTPGGINMAIEHSTVARNTATFEEAFGAAAFANQPNAGVGSPTLFGGANAAITIRNSILGARSPGYNGSSTVFFDAAQNITNITATNTLLEWTGGAPASFCNGAGMKCNVGSMVSPIAFNGGNDNTRTMALLAGSPAINAGGAVLGGLTTDQRGSGFPRVVGSAVDIGALESDAATTYGCTLDLDANGNRDALTDGLLVMRALFGMTGTAATTGAVGASATRSNWAMIQGYLNLHCGTTFAP